MLASIYTVSTLIISAAYVYMLIFVLKQWRETPDYSTPRNSSPQLSLSFIIPARNEAINIGQCLDSILVTKGKSPHHIEVVVIDDHSHDATAEIVRSYSNQGVLLLQLQDELDGYKVNAYKKMALSYGLKKAKGDYLIQLDADVTVPNDYLECISSAIINNDPDFIAGPVHFEGDDSLLSNFQSLDMLGMMLLTAAGIKSKKWYMANGANMIYKKDLIKFSDNPMASGDDIYGIQQLASNRNRKIYFLKNNSAAVTTAAESTYSALYRQRIRWSTKNKNMSSPTMLLMMAIPLVNVLWLLTHIIAGFWLGSIMIAIGCFHLLSILAIDYVYLREATAHFNKEKSMNYFLQSFLMHLMYIGGIGIMSLFVKKYKWKGRKVT